MMSIEQVLALIPVSRTTLWQMEGERRFPTGHYISNNRKVWFADEVVAWQNALPRTTEGYIRPSRAGLNTPKQAQKGPEQGRHAPTKSSTRRKT